MLSVLLAASIAASPGVVPAPAAPVPLAATGAVRETLPNGMRVVLLPDRLAPVATVVMEYGVGSDQDTMPGIAHATEHMMYRGTDGVSAAQFSDIADRMGAEYNAETSNEFTYYYFELPSPYVEVALQLEADRMNGAAMRQSDWAVERKAIEQEVRAQESRPAFKFGLKMSKLFYGDSPLANPTVGTVESFDKMTAADIATFYHAWYRPNNATLIVSGDIDPAAVLARAHQLFDPVASATLPARAATSLGSLASTTLSDSIDFPLPICGLLFRGPGTTDPQYASSLVVTDVLNNGRGALADLAAGGSLLGAFDLQTALPDAGSTFVVGLPGGGGSASTAAKAISDALAAYRTAGLPHELIDAAKLRLSSTQAYTQSSISNLAFGWARAIGQHEDTPYVALDAVANLTDADVNHTFAYYYDPAHQLTALLDPAPHAAMPSFDSKAVAENVRYTPDKVEPLPAWAKATLDVPLRVPASAGSDVTVHMSNGMTLVIRKESVSPTVVVKGEVDMSPELYEPKGKEGVASIASALLPWGTTTYDRKAFDGQVDQIAAGVSLGDDFGLNVTAPNFERGVQLLADGMLHPALSAQAFDVVKTQALTGVAASQKLPSTQASIAQTDALYPPGDPRRRRATPGTIAAITLADVRRWYAFAYRPDLTTVSIVGDVDPVQARALVKKYFGAWKAFGPRPDFRFPNLPQRSPKRQTITVKSHSAVQSEVTMKEVLVLGRRDRDYVPLMLANTMLSGEGTGSLLFKELRQRDGYVYSVDSSIEMEKDGATFTISYASSPKDVDRAQAAAVAILRRLQTVPLDDVELQRAKALLVANRVLPLDSYGGIAGELLAEGETGITAAETDEFWKKLLATTPADIRGAMQRKVRPDHFLRVIVEPES